jgi:hypothetical protein
MVEGLKVTPVFSNSLTALPIVAPLFQATEKEIVFKYEIW